MLSCKPCAGVRCRPAEQSRESQAAARRSYRSARKLPSHLRQPREQRHAPQPQLLSIADTRSPHRPQPEHHSECRSAPLPPRRHQSCNAGHAKPVPQGITLLPTAVDPASPTARTTGILADTRTMPDLHQVVDLRTTRNPCLPTLARFHASIRLHFDSISKTAGPEAAQSCTMSRIVLGNNQTPSAPITAPILQNYVIAERAILPHYRMRVCKKVFPPIPATAYKSQRRARIVAFFPSQPSHRSRNGPTCAPSPSVAEESITTVECMPGYTAEPDKTIPTPSQNAR